MKNLLIFSFLVVVGCVQFVGDLLRLPTIKGIGFASHASPAPKVFTSQQGFETFSNRFYVTWSDAYGVTRETELTRQRYDGLRGPYNRRNAYGAAFSYGPILAADPVTAPMYQAVLEHAVCAGVIEEVGLRPDYNRPVTIRVAPTDPVSRSLNKPLTQTIRCSQ